MSRVTTGSCVAVLAVVAVALAQLPGRAQPSADPDSGMMAAMEAMSQTMAAAPLTGDPDHDFVAMMIPHHQGAIAMAQFELAHGKDPAMRKLAQAIITAQEAEIADMQAWQKEAAKPP